MEFYGIKNEDEVTPLSFLEAAEKLIESNPATNKDKQRFGNIAFRAWYGDVEKLYDGDFSKQLS